MGEPVRPTIAFVRSEAWDMGRLIDVETEIHKNCAPQSSSCARTRGTRQGCLRWKWKTGPFAMQTHSLHTDVSYNC